LGVECVLAHAIAALWCQPLREKEAAVVENISPTATWQSLASDPLAQMVDVRTDAEWSYVGFPDVSALGKRIVTISWQVFPAMQVNSAFMDELRAAGLTPEHKIFFLCRSGVRSLHAAEAAMAAGFPHSFNIADGFEGPPDGDGHRGTVAGWKVEALPWRQR
jgi:rhodanese-related sulfurtransferase